MEKDYCNKCGACCRNIAVDFEKKILFRDGVQMVVKPQDIRPTDKILSLK